MLGAIRLGSCQTEFHRDKPGGKNGCSSQGRVFKKVGTMKLKLNRHGRFAAVAILGAALVGGTAIKGSANGDRPEERPAIQRLEQPIGLVWSRVPLRGAIDRLAESQNVAIWLDRRVDPEQLISLTARDEPLGDVLARLAKKQGLGLCRFESVIYLGPPASAARLRTLGAVRHEEARKLPSSIRRRFSRKARMGWDDLAMPRELLAELGREGEFRIDDLDRVEHDLWPGFELPRLDLVDRLTLILAPFDLTFMFVDRGAAIRLVPIPERVALRRSYSAGPRAAETARRWQAEVSQSRVTVEGNHVVVEGPLEDHERLAVQRRPTTAERPKPQKQDHSGIDRLRIDRVKFTDQPLAPVVRQLAAQLKLELRFDPDSLRRSGVDVDRRISVELRNVTVDELFRAVLEPAGLTFRRDGSTIEIFADEG